jgi:uncharacterized low-complexity protein
MSKKTLIAAAAGSAFVAGLAAAPVASAAENPFALSGLSSGYQVADSHTTKTQSKTQTKTQTETKSQEGKCGGKTEADMKAKEGKCGNEAKMKDGKCGEGKCGADAKSQGDVKKAAPGKTSSEKK